MVGAITKCVPHCTPSVVQAPDRFFTRKTFFGGSISTAFSSGDTPRGRVELTSHPQVESDTVGMQMSATDLLTKIVLPLTTFVLGVVCTLFVKRREVRRQLYSEHIKNLRKVTADWYNRLMELRPLPNQRSTSSGIEIEQAIYRYIHNRNDLPQLLESLAVVREDPRNAVLVTKVEDFLSLITDYKVRTDRPPLDPFAKFSGSEPLVACSPLLDGGLSEQGMDELFTHLDRCVQVVSNESAKCLISYSRFV